MRRRSVSAARGAGDKSRSSVARALGQHRAENVHGCLCVRACGARQRTCACRADVSSAPRTSINPHACEDVWCRAPVLTHRAMALRLLRRQNPRVDPCQIDWPSRMRERQVKSVSVHVVNKSFVGPHQVVEVGCVEGGTGMPWGLPHSGQVGEWRLRQL